MKKREEDDEDAPDPSRVPEQRSHVASGRSAAAGRRVVAAPGSSARRGPGAGLDPQEPSSSMETRRRRFGREVSSSHSRPARTSSANVRRDQRYARATAPSAASWPSRPARMPAPDALGEHRLALVERVGEPALAEALRVLPRAPRRSGPSATPRGAYARARPTRRSRPGSARWPSAGPCGARGRLHSVQSWQPPLRRCSVPRQHGRFRSANGECTAPVAAATAVKSALEPPESRRVRQRGVPADRGLVEHDPETRHGRHAEIAVGARAGPARRA